MAATGLQSKYNFLILFRSICHNASQSMIKIEEETHHLPTKDTFIPTTFNSWEMFTSHTNESSSKSSKKDIIKDSIIVPENIIMKNSMTVQIDPRIIPMFNQDIHQF
ncbi:hypothetical protein HZS_1664 [Henneguya salminicola]|nr:hypothetical protein HZS_1664 [Henneguya salminicola]